MSELQIENRSERDLPSCELIKDTNKAQKKILRQFTQMIFIIYTSHHPLI